MTMRMLITDDDPSLLALYRALLGRMTEVVADYASTADDALTLIGTRHYDLALLDINLTPDPARREGISLLARLRASAPDTEAVMMSSLDDDATVQQCLGLGATAFTSKNHDFVPTLLGRVRDALGRRTNYAA